MGESDVGNVAGAAGARPVVTEAAVDADAEVRWGGCLCGAVRFTVRPPLRDVFACHCHRCRRTSGNFVAATAAPASAVGCARDDELRWFRPHDDEGVEYGFCATCGSSLFFRVVGGESISIMAGSLDDPSGLRTTQVWFDDEAAPHTVIGPDVERFRGSAAD